MALSIFDTTQSNNKYITKKVRVVSLACDTPTGLLFIPIKYESNPLKNKGNIQL